MNAKISVFVICVKLIIYLLLDNQHDTTFKLMDHRPPTQRLAESIIISERTDNRNIHFAEHKHSWENT